MTFHRNLQAQRKIAVLADTGGPGSMNTDDVNAENAPPVLNGPRADLGYSHERNCRSLNAGPPTPRVRPPPFQPFYFKSTPAPGISYFGAGIQGSAAVAVASKSLVIGYWLVAMKK